MKQISVLMIVGAIAISVAGAMTFSAAGTDYESPQIFGGKLPPGYRDRRLISVAHEEGKLNDIRAILGNDIAIKAYRDAKLPFPTVRSLPGSPGVMSRQRKITKPLVIPNLLLQDPYQCLIYGQELTRICLDRRLGLRPI